MYVCMLMLTALQTISEGDLMSISEARAYQSISHWEICRLSRTNNNNTPWGIWHHNNVSRIIVLVVCKIQTVSDEVHTNLQYKFILLNFHTTML